MSKGGMTMSKRDIGIILALFLLIMGIGHSTAIASGDADSIMCDNGVVQIGDFFQTV